MKELYLFIALCFVGYLLMKNFNYREGMTDASGNTSVTDNGIAGNAASYAASLKATTVKYQDLLLISKYRTEYETVILNLDDLINNLMLNEALSANPSNPITAIENLAKMNQAKTALNSVMKFVDGQ